MVINMCIYIYICICSLIDRYRKGLCVYIIRVYIYIQMYMQMYMYIHAPRYHVYIYIYAYIHVYVCIYSNISLEPNPCGSKCMSNTYIVAQSTSIRPTLGCLEPKGILHAPPNRHLTRLESGSSGASLRLVWVG